MPQGSIADVKTVDKVVDVKPVVNGSPLQAVVNTTPIQTAVYATSVKTEVFAQPVQPEAKPVETAPIGVRAELDAVVAPQAAPTNVEVKSCSCRAARQFYQVRIFLLNKTGTGYWVCGKYI